ncbi:MAG: type II toxin-antitoxin system HicA family toxin [Deltaproteobacteria bacterium]|nr:type II toxin-antitoxin system HicA family toxin [Deltaproteobacteria bacterium]
MKSLTGKELCKILEKNGWILKRIQGSHHLSKFYRHTMRCITIPLYLI